MTFENLRKKDGERICNEPDFKYKTKKAGTYTLEMIGGTNRGAMIVVWETVESYEKLCGISPRENDLSDNKKFTRVDEIHFMYFDNAKDEWFGLKTTRNVLDIMQRNG